MLPVAPLPKLPFNISQVRLIRNLNLFLSNTVYGSTGFSLDRRGVCAGLVAQYLKHKARGTEYEFLDMLTAISNLTPDKYAADADKVAKFCQEVGFSFSPEQFSKLRNIGQGDLDLILRGQGAKIEPRFQLGIRWSTDKLNDLWDKIIKEDHMVFLGSTVHAIGAYKKNNKYYLYDPNSKKGEKVYYSLEEFNRAVKKRLAFNGESADLFVKIFQDKNVNPEPAEPFLPKSYFIDSISLKDDPNYINSLNQAVIVNDVEMVEELLRRGADPFALPETRNCAFMLASSLGFHNIVETIVRHARPNPIDEDIYTAALLKSLEKGHAETSNYLIANKFAHEPGYISGKIKLLFDNACAGGAVSTIALVLHHDANKVIGKNEKSMANGIMLAANHGHTEAVRYLLDEFKLSAEKHADVVNNVMRSAIQKNNFPLYAAMTLRVKPNDTHLQLAIVSGSTRHINAMLEAGMEVNFEHIKLAVRLHNMQDIQVLLSSKARCNPASRPLVELLRGAINGNLHQCRELLQLVRDADFAKGLLLTAICCNQMALLAVLKASDVKLDPNNRDAGDKLINACEKGDYNAVMMLVREGINPQQTTAIETPHGSIQLDLVQTAMHFRHIDILLGLLNSRIPLSGERALEVLAFACRRGRNDVIEALQKNYQLDLNGADSLQLASLTRHYATVMYLLDHGADINRVPGSVIFDICKNGAVSFMAEMVKKHPEIRDALTPFDVGLQILIAASDNNARQIAALALIHPVPDMMKDDLKNVLTQSLKNGRTEVAKQLFRLGARLDNADLSEHLARSCQAHDPDLANLLLEQGAKLKQNDATPLLTAAYTRPGERAGDMREVAELASLYGHAAVLQTIEQLSPRERPTLQSHPRGEAPTTLFQKDPSMALYRACKMGDLELVKNLVLVKHVDFRKELEVLLDGAAQKNQLHIIAFLAGRLSTEEVNKQLATALNSKSFVLAAVLLEVMKPTDLLPRLRQYAQKNARKLSEAFQQQMAAPGAQSGDDRRRDAVDRKANALGTIISADAASVQAGRKVQK